MFKLGLIETMAFGGAVLFLGYAVRRAVKPLDRYNVPAPVIGGLLVSAAVAAARHWGAGVDEKSFDLTLSTPLMIAFFTTIGFGASFRLLKTGGPQVLLFFGLCAIAAVLQNVVGAAVAVATGRPPLFGVLCGSVTLTGGPGTGLAFAPLFEKAGVTGAAAIATAAATAGIVTGGLIGGPVGTLLIERLRRGRAASGLDAVPGHCPDIPPGAPPVAAEIVEARLPDPPQEVPAGEAAESYLLLKSFGVLLAAMWAGSWIGIGLSGLNVTLPAYIGAMLAAAAVRNFDDATGLIGLSQRTLDEIGDVALSFFLVLTLMTLKLWDLAAVAGPLAAILVAQAALVAAFCLWPVFPAMGRDYDAAVTAGGFCGFMMGTTANAMANMDALARRFGPAPRAFLVVPLVGAFFIDFANALLITACLNLFG